MNMATIIPSHKNPTVIISYPMLSRFWNPTVSEIIPMVYQLIILMVHFKQLVPLTAAPEGPADPPGSADPGTGEI